MNLEIGISDGTEEKYIIRTQKKTFFEKRFYQKNFFLRKWKKIFEIWSRGQKLCRPAQSTTDDRVVLCANPGCADRVVLCAFGDRGKVELQ